MNTTDTITYNKNCAALKKLCAEMERLIALCDYDKKLMRTESYYVDVMNLDKVRKEIDRLFDQQLNLFFNDKSHAKLTKTTVTAATAVMYKPIIIPNYY